MTSKNLYIFLHIPRSAGTTFIKHMQKNFTEKEAIWIDYEKLDLDPFESKHKNYLNQVNKYFSAFSRNEKEGVKIISGHLVPFGVHKLFDKTARYITFVRDPLERTISLYNYYRTLYLNEDKSGRKKDFYKFSLLVNGRLPSFQKWCVEKYDKPNSRSTSETMYKFLMGLNYIDDDKLKVGTINSMFKKFYFVGITENFTEDSLFLYEEIGVTKFFINQNVSKKFFPFEYSDEVKEVLCSKNKLDQIIYKKALDVNKEFKSKNENFYLSLSKIKRRRRLLLLVTQIMYDFNESLHRLSSFFREKSIFYSHLIDFIKRKNI